MGLRQKRLFLLDIDGTVSLDATLLPGSMDFFRHVLESGGKYVFITNNSTRSVADYVEKFRRMGVPADESSFVTASTATVQYLKARHAEDRIFVVGTRSFRAELARAGLSVTEALSPDVSCALVGFDDELTYEKARALCELLCTRPGMPYLATNPDLACPVGFGAIPDCGAICGMIRCATGREPVYIGKPNPIIVDMCLAQTGFSKEQTLVIGDRLYTDIACGIAAGVDTAVVFTGEAKPEDLASTAFPPAFAFPSIRELDEAVF